MRIQSKDDGLEGMNPVACRRVVGYYPSSWARAPILQGVIQTPYRDVSKAPAPCHLAHLSSGRIYTLHIDPSFPQRGGIQRDISLKGSPGRYRRGTGWSGARSALIGHQAPVCSQATARSGLRGDSKLSTDGKLLTSFRAAARQITRE